jgi:kynurenine formamidase
MSRSGWIERLVGPDGRIVDLTAPLRDSTPVFPTDPRFELRRHMRYADCGCNLSAIRTGLHAGTHVDVPLHFIDGGPDVTSMPVSTFLGDAVAIDIPKEPGQDVLAEDLAGADIHPGDIVLIRTGWEARAGAPEFFQDDWPGFSVEAVDALVGLGARAIGGDIASADSPTGLWNGARAHRRAMVTGLPIFEALVNLREVVGRRFVFVGLPLKIDGAEGSPVRAIAILAPGLLEG